MDIFSYDFMVCNISGEEGIVEYGLVLIMSFLFIKVIVYSDFHYIVEVFFVAAQ